MKNNEQVTASAYISKLLDEIEKLEHELCRCRETINALREINDNQWGIINDMRKESKR